MDVFVVVLLASNACGTCQQPGDALRPAGCMPGRWVTPEATSFSATSACEKGHQGVNALQRGVTAYVISLSSAISACEKGHQWGDALKLSGGMPQRQATLDVVNFSAAISACEKCQQWGGMRCGRGVRCRSAG